MSLSTRIESSELSLTSLEQHQVLKKLVRQRLYEKIPPHGIAQLIEENPQLAQRELVQLIEESSQEISREEAHLFNTLCSEVGESVEVALVKIRAALLDDILGMGPIDTLLQDPSVTEVMVNSTEVFFERGGRIYSSDITFDDEEHVRLIIDRIITPLGRRLDERTPLVNARLPQGHRVNAVIPPITPAGPVLTIRKFRETIYSLSELVAFETMSSEVAQFLKWAIKAKLNIAVTGGTSSGKTTLLNALSVAVDHGERIITIEDSAELRFQTHPHVISLEARPPTLEGKGEITIRDLVANSLRMRPDRIIVGECRGGEALDMLQAMNTGHSGSLTTLHANSPKDAISRLATLVRYAVDIPLEAIEQQIFSALDLIVHQQRTSEGKRIVTSIVALEGRELTPVFELETAQGKGQGKEQYLFKRPQSLIARFLETNAATEEQVARWEKSCIS